MSTYQAAVIVVVLGGCWFATRVICWLDDHEEEASLVMAKAVPGYIKVELGYSMGRVLVLETSCSDETHFAKLPPVVEYDGRRYGKTTWHSDTSRAYYRTDAELAKSLRK